MSDGTTEGDSAGAVRTAIVGYDGPGLERVVSTDQANLSIAVDERYLVKWLRQTVTTADLDTLETLRAAGFEHMPRFVGGVMGEGRVVALVHEFVLGATDGWQWYVDDVLAWLDADADAALAELVDTAAQMGAITAEMHAALAGGHCVRAASLAPLCQRIAQLCATAFALTTGDEGDRLAARREAVERAIAPLADLDLDLVPMQRVHGDLHAGQFLRSGGRLLLADFDGDPTVEASERLSIQPVERDLAGLLQSLDHVGRVAARRRSGADVEPFIGAAIDACLAAYRSRCPVDDRLLAPLRVAQELHEFVYAATRLPVWLYVPDAALQRLFPSPARPPAIAGSEETA